MEEIGQSLTRMEQVTQLAKQTLNRHQLRMPQKYANIQATLKLLNNLICNFTKRADQHEQYLRHRAKIGDLQDQISFHRQRITDCQRLSEALNQKVSQQKNTILQEENTVNQLRKQLLTLKTDNVKKVLQLQKLELKRKNEEEKENMETRKTTWKLKTQYSRAFHSNLSPQEDHLANQKRKVVKSLYKALNNKKITWDFLEEGWRLAKQKLYKHEKKANVHGLNGSLMFRMIENERPNTLKVPDSKLIIYDVLRERYREKKREERREKVGLTEEQFMEMSPAQILGLVELKGGIGALREAMIKMQAKITVENQN